MGAGLNGRPIIFDDLDPNPHFLKVEYLKNGVLGTKLLKNTDRKPYTIYRMVLLSTTLSDL